MKLNVLMILLVVGGLCIGASVANGEIIAQFENGSTTPGVDTVPGTAGDGWRSGWDLDSSGTGTKARALGSTSPLYLDPSSNNYLAYTQSDTGGDGYSSSLNRRYYLTDLNDDYYISFSIRFDDIGFLTDIDTTNGNGSDRLYISNTTDDDYSHQAAETGWALRIQGNDAAGSSATALQFRFLTSGTGPGTTSSEYSGSNLTVQDDHLYEITIAVHNGNHTYEGTVKDVTTGVSYTTAQPHNMESAVNADYLSFITEMRNQGGSTMGYSIDNVRIANTAPIPEPGTLVILTSMLAGLLIRRKK